jgi:DNA-binding CsgD family transcriptional regulator
MFVTTESETNINVPRQEQASPTGLERRRGLTGTRANGHLALLRFLMTRPTCDRIAQYAVVKMMGKYGCRAASISLFDISGALHVVGTYGVPHQSLAPYESLSLWDSSPMSDAVITGEPVIMLTADEVRSAYPWLGPQSDLPYEPMVVWPLALPHETVGAVQFILAEEPIDLNALRTQATVIATSLALYLSLLGATGSLDNQLVFHNGDNEETIPPDTGLQFPQVISGFHPNSKQQSLTARQLSVLKLMGEGHTNIDIADEIGFSVSTVRHETMALYRFFGVSGREGAVRVAKARGILH